MIYNTLLENCVDCKSGKCDNGNGIEKAKSSQAARKLISHGVSPKAINTVFNVNI